MHEPLTTQLVAEKMQELLTAFPSRHAGQNIAHTAEVYRNGLRGISGESFRAAVDIAIKTDSYFPKIARLREIASEWTKRNTVNVAQRHDGRVCTVCGKEPSPRERWRPKVDPLFRELRSADGKYVLLESFTRDYCDCAPPCFWEPQAGLTEPACHVDDVQRSYRAWMERRSTQKGARGEIDAA